MRAKLDRKQFLGLVKAAASVARAGDDRPVLRNILIEVTETEIVVSATDMTLSLRLSARVGESVEAMAPGRVLVPAQNLQRVISSIYADEILLVQDGNNCMIEAGGNKFSLVTEDPRDFPQLNRFDPTAPSVEIASDKFVGLMNRVVYAAHDERSYFNMHGLLLKVAKGRLTLVATNGQRLAVASSDIAQLANLGEDDGLFVAEQVIPADSAAVLTSLTDPSNDESVHIQWFDKSLRVRAKYGEAIIAALHGGFVPYEMGIPDNNKSLRMRKTELQRLLKQIVAIKSAGIPFMMLTLRDNSMTMQTNVRDAGSTVITETVDWTHDALSVYLNPTFIAETAKNMSSEEVVFKFGGPMDQPVLVEDSASDLESMCVFSVVREP